nr:MAG TPA: hypothetical protein [Caudoviricetes sp.]
MRDSHASFFRKFHLTSFLCCFYLLYCNTFIIFVIEL